MADSVSEWLGRLKSGEEDAAEKLWNRYSAELVELARRKLSGVPRSAADEEDVAQSVFSSICRGAAAGRFAAVKTRDDLWWMLLTITKQKTVNHMRREMAKKRGAGRTVSESQVADEGSGHFVLDDLAGPALSPDFLATMEEQYQRLLSLLRNDRLRLVAISRVEGYTVTEIATKLGISARAVERKLQLIRAQWAKDVSEVD